MTDSKGAAIELLKYFWPFPYPEHMPPIEVSFSNGLPEGDHDPDHMVFVVPYSAFETAILALLAQEVKPDKVDRFEVIDETGRAYVKGSIYGSPVSVELSYQDDGRTLKVFVSDRKAGLV